MHLPLSIALPSITYCSPKFLLQGCFPITDVSVSRRLTEDAASATVTSKGQPRLAGLGRLKL